ncbi:MAG: PAS domain-containing protein [Chloroflexi bacterium]|nr:PAS domain-containing protein [Chloroflexota bacterium]
MAKPSRFLFGTLRGRLILSVALVHAIMMSLFIVDLTVRQRDMLLNRQIEEATALSQALATSSAGWIAANDIAGLQELVDAQDLYPEILFVILADKDGRVLASTDTSRQGQYILDLPQEVQLTVLSSAPSLVDVVVPAMIAGRHVGWARVGIGQTAASEELAIIVRNGVLYAVAAILIGSVIAWFMGNQITKRLYAIQETMDAIRTGNPLARSTLSGKDEPALMAQEFNSMLDNLEERSAELRRTNTLMNMMVENIPNMIFLKDARELRFVLFNQAGEDLLGYSRNDLLGKNDYDFFPKEQADFFTDMDRTVLNGHAVVDIPQEPLQTRHKGLRTLHTKKVPLLDANGVPEYLLGISEDITERERAKLQIEKQLKRLSALRAIDIVIKSSFDLKNTLKVLLTQLAVQLKADAASILLFNKETLTLSYSAGHGFRSTAIHNIKLKYGESLAGQILLEREVIHISDLRKTENEIRPALAGEDFISYVGVPLVAKGEAVGVLEIFQRTELNPDPDWFEFLDTLAGQAAIAIDNTGLFENLQRSNLELTLAYEATIEGWSQALDLRDKETEGHTQRVAAMTEKLAKQMGIPDSEIIHIRRGALLHDIGKLSVPDNILFKADKLTEEEWQIMRQHPVNAKKMLTPIAYLKQALEIPSYHHEKWDGSGYPNGLRGEQIPLSARIFAIVDVFDAITSDRPYRKAWTDEQAFNYIREQSGTHFDPQVVEKFLEFREG